MRHNPGGEPDRITDLVQVITKLMQDCFLAVPAGQQPPIGGQWIEGAKESQSMDEMADKRIDRNHTFSFQFAKRDVYCPLVGAGGAEAIEGQIGALANAHTRVAHQQKSVGAQVVASEELLLQQLVLLCGERPRESVWQTWNILGTDQMGEFRMLLHPSQFHKDAAERQEQIDIGCGHQRWRLRAKARHPPEDVRITVE
jgi:hypothetical protein